MKAVSLLLLGAGLAWQTGFSQTVKLGSTADLPVKTDHALTGLIDSMLQNKCRMTCREKDKRVAHFMIYPENGDHISFLQFTDTDSSGTYGRNELTYAELSDAYTDIVVENKGDSAIELKTRVVERNGIIKGASYTKAKAVFDKSPAPLKESPERVTQWIIDRNTRKYEL